MAKNKINGWLIIDKPYAMGSTSVVGKLKWLLKPEKIGHAGTLDPLATGVLPIAFGSATKTIPFVMDGQKTYEFEVTWGRQTTTDDVEGETQYESDLRPTRTAIESVLPQFIGQISQMPPQYSALKINGKRAYDLARSGEEVVLKPRLIQIDSLQIISHTPEKTVFQVQCGKGTYVRSIGRDLGQMLGCYGYITRLRRIKCGPFDINMSILLENLEKVGYNEVASKIISPLTALDDILVLAVGDTEKEALLYGKSITFPLQDMTCNPSCPKNFSDNQVIGLKWKQQLCALATYENGQLKPFRVFAV
ncbi:MAG: tRNA pseudouridine(55) synthase TruB [Alphaproteobacteria bacterium]|nr:tRNA pseudouridine(55) synthase TruB [Alphaproteobacteria bacterium]